MPSPFPIPNTCRREFHVSKVLRPILKINYVRERSKCFPCYFKNRRLTCSSRRPTFVLTTFVLVRALPNRYDLEEFRECGDSIGWFVRWKGKSTLLDGSDCTFTFSQSAVGLELLCILSVKKCPRHVAQVSR